MYFFRWGALYWWGSRILFHNSYDSAFSSSIYSILGYVLKEIMKREENSEISSENILVGDLGNIQIQIISWKKVK